MAHFALFCQYTRATFQVKRLGRSIVYGHRPVCQADFHVTPRRGIGCSLISGLVPKVALAPFLLVWFGFGLESKVVMVALVCFFPMFINTAIGLKQTNPAILDLMHAFSASRWHVLTGIKIPSAAGHIFAGLQIAIVLGLIGVVVAEFVSSTRGLGYLISAAAVNLETDTMFAALLSLAAIGLVANQTIRFLHDRVVFWDKPSVSQTAATE